MNDISLSDVNKSSAYTCKFCRVIDRFSNIVSGESLPVQKTTFLQNKPNSDNLNCFIMKCANDADARYNDWYI